MSFTRQQERHLDRLLKQRGINKQQFIAEQLAGKIEEAKRQEALRRPCALDPRDPVTGAKPTRSIDPFTHVAHRKWPRSHRIWIEKPLVVHLLRGTRHERIETLGTMWASTKL
jgi:hypothetical protein